MKMSAGLWSWCQFLADCPSQCLGPTHTTCLWSAASIFQVSTDRSSPSHALNHFCFFHCRLCLLGFLDPILLCVYVCVWWEVSPMHNTKQFSDPSRGSNNSTLTLPRDSARWSRLRALADKTALQYLSPPYHSRHQLQAPGCYLCLWQVDCKLDLFLWLE